MEELDFEIKLLSNTIDNCPSIKIGIDSTEYFNGEVLGEQTVKFSASVLDNFNLNIDYAGNNPADLILNDEGMPINAVTVTVDSVKIEGIDVTEIAYNHSKFNIDPNEKYIEDYQLEECMELGPRGVWTMPIQSPVYIWILENL
tara:strand:+ start:1899 stop:2330 length:432 start_codon:yes stop_codon:yes gene_type:complete